MLENIGNTVLRWMMDNIYVKTDPACNIQAEQRKSTDCIGKLK